MTDDKPTTAEGTLLCTRRKMLGLTIEQAAGPTTLGASKWGDIERGRTRATKTEPPKEWHAEAPDVAIMAIRLKVAAAELREVGRADAALIVEREAANPSPTPVAPVVGSDAAALDRMVEALIGGRPDADTIRFLWRGMDGEGRLKPLPDRVSDVVNWVQGRPARQAQEGLKLA